MPGTSAVGDDDEFDDNESKILRASSTGIHTTTASTCKHFDAGLQYVYHNTLVVNSPMYYSQGATWGMSSHSVVADRL